MDDFAQQLPAPLRPTRLLSRIILVAVGLYVLCNALHIVILSLLRSSVRSGQPLSPLMTELDTLQTKLPLLGAPLYLFAGICFLVLVSRLVANLPTLGSQTMLTPSAAVWSFLIPIVNLVGGYRTTRTIWTESQPVTRNFATPQAVPLLGLWWASYLALGLTSRLIQVGTKLPDGFTIEQWSNASYWLSVDALVNLVAGGLFMCVVFLLDRRQSEQHDDLTRRVPVAMRSDLLR